MTDLQEETAPQPVVKALPERDPECFDTGGDRTRRRRLQKTRQRRLQTAQQEFDQKIAELGGYTNR